MCAFAIDLLLFNKTQTFLHGKLPQVHIDFCRLKSDCILRYFFRYVNKIDWRKLFIGNIKAKFMQLQKDVSLGKSQFVIKFIWSRKEMLKKSNQFYFWLVDLLNRIISGFFSSFLWGWISIETWQMQSHVTTRFMIRYYTLSTFQLI